MNRANVVKVTELAGATSSNYPIQIGRPFLEGEIPNYPQALVNGVPVQTQADVKLRWNGGSVRYAILSFLVPTLKARATVTVTFRNQTTGNNTNYETAANMLDPRYNFDAVIKLTSGETTVGASARNMVSAGALSYWIQGPVATSVIVADHSATRAFDIGFDPNKSFRPIFHATFWPAISKVHVRFIGEDANTAALQDQTYDLTLETGNNPRSAVYTRSSVIHHAATRWTKESWIGGAPPAIAIDHNAGYLARTGFIPNYDLSKKVSKAAIARASEWLARPPDIYAVGDWTLYMPEAGGRAEIGPLPLWTVLWLYTFDNRVRAQAFGNADLAAAWPMHFREGSAGKAFDAVGRIPAIGRVLSINARPTVFLHTGNSNLEYKYTTPKDRISPIGRMADGGWVADGAHQPDPFSVQYLLTGDFWYLEELQFWASWGAADTNPGNIWSGRGPTGSAGNISGEVRAEAWLFRNRVLAAALSPDGTPEKSYFDGLTRNVIAIWEGKRHITGTGFENTPLWNWGSTVSSNSHDNPLHFWNDGEPDQVDGPIDPAMCGGATSPWMQNFLIFSLGQARSLGYPTDGLLSWMGANLIGQLTDPAYTPYAAGAYRMCTQDPQKHVLTSWSQVRAGFSKDYEPTSDFQRRLFDAEHGYSIILITGAAQIANLPHATETWRWVQRHGLTAPSLNDNPKWALLPR